MDTINNQNRVHGGNHVNGGHLRVVTVRLLTASAKRQATLWAVEIVRTRLEITTMN
jgi:hypothetical protein